MAKSSRKTFLKENIFVFVCCNFSSLNAMHVNYFFLIMCEIHSIIKILYANNLEFRNFKLSTRNFFKRVSVCVMFISVFITYYLNYTECGCVLLRFKKIIPTL